jgi:hypothetical protein
MSDKMIQIPLPFEEHMTTFDAIMIAEGVYQAKSQQQYIEAWQMLIDTGMAYQLQGWFGRTANALIEEGHCTAPTTNTQPYSC